MRKIDFLALTQICSDIYRNEPTYSQLINESPQISAARIREDIRSIFALVSDVREESEQVAEIELQPALALLELGLTQLCDLVLLSIRRSEAHQPVLSHEVGSSWSGAEPAFVFETLIATLTNTLLAVRTLVCFATAATVVHSEWESPRMASVDTRSAPQSDFGSLPRSGRWC